MFDSAQDLAACLGLEETQIRKLQARGYLLALALHPAEVRERLYHAHRRYRHQQEPSDTGTAWESSEGSTVSPCDPQTSQGHSRGELMPARRGPDQPIGLEYRGLDRSP